ncbi:MAG: DUF3566 domain-containing protein [Mycobacterium sp.]
MTSPNEPGSGERPASVESRTDVPPWQSGARPRPDTAVPRPAAPSPPRGADPRASRYVTGLAAPDLSAMSPLAQRPDPEPAPARTDSRTDLRTDRNDAVLTAALPSELPDLSGPAPRPAPPRKASADAATAAPPRFQVGARHRGPVRASMQIRRIDPWSALKVSLLLNAALFFVWMIAVAFLYLALAAMGVWSKLNSNVGDLLTSGDGGGGDLVSAGSIFGGAALIGLVNIVLLTAMATVGAYIYNLSTDIVGGVEVTLADLD